MPTDFSTLLRRDHSDLLKEVALLLEPNASPAQLRAALDGVRLGITAHAEAEDIVLAPFSDIADVAAAIDSSRAQHLAQEAALAALVGAWPGTQRWTDRARALSDQVRSHAAQDEAELLPALRAHLSDAQFADLAGAFATERLRQLSFLQPSAPVLIADLAAAM